MNLDLRPCAPLPSHETSGGMSKQRNGVRGRTFQKRNKNTVFLVCHQQLNTTALARLSQGLWSKGWWHLCEGNKAGKKTWGLVIKSLL